MSLGRVFFLSFFPHWLVKARALSLQTASTNMFLCEIIASTKFLWQLEGTLREIRPVTNHINTGKKEEKKEKKDRNVFSQYIRMA